MAPSLGPVLGGVLAAKKSWRWIFWLLVVMPGTTFLTLVLFLPETQRKRVGNGSVPVRGIYWCLTTYSIKDKIDINQVAPKSKHQFPSPLSSLIILRDKGSLTLMLIGSLTYVSVLTLQTSLAAQCIEIYDLDYLQAGLVYLPAGVSSGVGSFITGKILDWNYRRIAISLGNDTFRHGGHATQFPIEYARLEGMYMLIAVNSLSTVGYGLVLMTKTVRERYLYLCGLDFSSLVAYCYNASHAGIGRFDHLEHFHGQFYNQLYFGLLWFPADKF
jgi:MFS family permease